MVGCYLWWWIDVVSLVGQGKGCHRATPYIYFTLVVVIVTKRPDNNQITQICEPNKPSSKAPKTPKPAKRKRVEDNAVEAIPVASSRTGRIVQPSIVRGKVVANRYSSMNSCTITDTLNGYNGNNRIAAREVIF